MPEIYYNYVTNHLALIYPYGVQFEEEFVTLAVSISLRDGWVKIGDL